MTIGEIVLSTFCQVVFELLLTQEVKVFLKLWGGSDLPKTLKLWERKLRMMEALLSDAEQKRQSHTSAVELWLEHLQDLAFDMEDILDTFATEAQSCELKAKEDQESALKVKPGILNKMAQSLCASCSRAGEKLSNLFNPDRQFIQSRIDDITERLEYIETEAQKLGLSPVHNMQQQTHHTDTLQKQRESTSLEREVLGRDAKKQEIIAKLLKDEQSDENYVVTPIVGQGGIGKTTLAQYVYNDEQQLKGHFDLKAWVCVSDEFDVKRVTTAIINSATSRNLSFCNLEQAQVELKGVLNGKRFLIVLDDVWTDNDDDWDKLQTPFRHGAKGSRVIMTTRIVTIARMMIDNPTQRNVTNLEGLSDDDSWSIFQLHASKGSDLSQFREDIIKKCNGLPLAAKALGGLFKKTVNEKQRQLILNSDVWSEKSNVLAVLRLSYYHLPSTLKRVFAYCSVFPKDYDFKEEEVVLLWMAQGFLPENQTGTMKDMGCQYFDDLVSRSLFERHSDLEECFTMHDLIHDVALWAAGDICYALDSKGIQRDPERIRHLFFSESRIDGKLENQRMVSQLRTFICPHYYYESGLHIEILNYIQRFQYIRTLRLVSREIAVIPDSIGELRHLRFLNLSLNRIRVLPKSIGKLYNLQTLDLRGCVNLEKVPNVSSLVKLRHIYIKGTSLHKMPEGIGELTNLQSLDIFILAIGEGFRVKELRDLNHLCGELYIFGLENVTKVEDAREAHLDDKKGIDELHLVWKPCRDEVDDNTERDVLEQLKPHTSIRKCWLYGYMGLRFPNWFANPSFTHLVKIKLEICEKCECLPPLGQLPLLENLLVQGMNGIKEVGPEFYGDDGLNPFPSLRTLSFQSMKSWKKWVRLAANNIAFPHLEKLEIRHCVSLQGDLPPYLHLPELKELTIDNCDGLRVSLSSFPKIEKFDLDTTQVLSTTGDTIRCTNWVTLDNLFEVNGFPERFPYLCKLRYENCQYLITEFLEDSCELARLSQLISLKEIHLWECKNMERLPSQLHSFTSLQSFVIQRVKIKQPIKEWGLHLLNSLHRLILEDIGSAADSIESIPSPELSLPSSLSDLSIAGFQNLKTIYSCNLTRLWVLHCPKLESWDGDFISHNSVEALVLYECPQFRSFPEGGLPRNLRSLGIRGTNINKPIQEWGMHLLTSLRSLTLEDVGGSTDSVECIEASYFPSSLSDLFIKGFKNLKTIRCAALPCLTKIWIYKCPMFEHDDIENFFLRDNKISHPYYKYDRRSSQSR